MTEKTDNEQPRPNIQPNQFGYGYYQQPVYAPHPAYIPPVVASVDNRAMDEMREQIKNLANDHDRLKREIAKRDKLLEEQKEEIARLTNENLRATQATAPPYDYSNFGYQQPQDPAAAHEDVLSRICANAFSILERGGTMSEEKRANRKNYR